MTSERNADDAVTPSQDSPGSEPSDRPRRRRRRRRVRGSASEDTSRRESREAPRQETARPEKVQPEEPAPSEDRGTQAPDEPRRRSRGRSRGGRRESAEPRERAPARRAEAPRTEFSRFGLPESLLRGLEAAGYEEPTEIQERMIPIALEGQNVVARSRTGTGKTCAFIVPALTRLEEVHEEGREHPAGPPRILVVVPTRELAIQVAAECERLTRFMPVRTSCVYGGTRLKDQFRSVPESAVVVGTPGRLLDHLSRRTFDGGAIDVLVLDEVDRMYDLGFREDVDRLLRHCSQRKQTLLVSATLNEDVEDLVTKHLPGYEKIEIESRSLTVDEVQQTFYVVHYDQKRELLMALLRKRNPERTIVFTRTKFTADRVAYVLQREGFDAHEIHSGLPQQLRERILGRFREGNLALLVATDVAARGLDIQGVDHVVNYDIPQAAEDYVHRVGRTARMGREGWAVTLVGPDDGPYLTEIEKLINKEIRQERFEGFEAPGAGRSPESEASSEDPATGEAEAAPEPPPSQGIPTWNRPKRRRR